MKFDMKFIDCTGCTILLISTSLQGVFKRNLKLCFTTATVKG